MMQSHSHSGTESEFETFSHSARKVELFGQGLQWARGNEPPEQQGHLVLWMLLGVGAWPQSALLSGVRGRGGSLLLQLLFHPGSHEVVLRRCRGRFSEGAAFPATELTPGRGRKAGASRPASSALRARPFRLVFRLPQLPFSVLSWL